MAKARNILVTLAALVVFGAIFAPSAFAECGPGFSSKSQLISYAAHNPGWAHGFRKELLKHSAYTGYQADETVNDYLRSSEQQVRNAHSGYRLKTNTYCPAGPGQYLPYSGLLDNMSGKPMLWHCPKGENCVPLLKGYCMNFVTGPPVRSHHPHKHKKPKHHKPKPPPSGPVCSGNTVTNGSSCGPCSTVVVGSGNIVTSNPECKPEEPKKPCGCTSTPEEPEKPCGCHPEEPEPTIKITAKTELNMIPAGKTSGDFYINVYASKSGGTLTVDPGIGGVSSCSSSTPEESISFSVPSGTSKECLILYAPEDADKPSSMTVGMSACLGSVCDTETETFNIEYPTRPS